MMKRHRTIRWLAVLACMLIGASLPTAAQDDDLQAYLDQLVGEASKLHNAVGEASKLYGAVGEASKLYGAVGEASKLHGAVGEASKLYGAVGEASHRRSPLRAESVEIPIGLPEVDLSAFTSSKNRTSPLVVNISVRLVNGSLTASPSFSGGGCLLQVSGGCSVVLDQSATIDAGSAPTSGCMAAVGIYGGSTFFQYGNVTAPASGTGIAIYLDSKQDTYCYYAGQTKGSISNEQGGQVIGIDENPQYNNGDTFAALTPEGVTMTFQVISASARTCRVGNGSTAAIATATKGVVTIPQKAKGYTVVKISNRAFIECSQLSFIGIPSTVTEIGETTFGSAVGAFHACSGITSFDIPGSVTLIGRGTFSSCVSLTELTIPSSVTVLGSNAFDHCTGLKSLTLSPNITAIELETFRNCQSLESITIPASVRSFGNSAFQGCSSLKTLTSLVQQPFAFGSGVFSSYDVRLYVPAGTKSRYQGTACWNRFYHIYTIGTNEELEDIQEMFATISQQLDALAADQQLTAQQTAVVKSFIGNAELNSLIDTQLAALQARLSALRTTYEQLKAAVSAAGADYAALRSQTEQLWSDVAALTNAQNAYKQEVATRVGNIIKAELESTVAQLTAVQVAINTNIATVNAMADQIGTDFFMRQAGSTFTGQLNSVAAGCAADATGAAQIVNSFNRMFGNTTITTIEQAVTLYESYAALKEQAATLQTSVAGHQADVASVAAAFEALPVVFPDEDMAWTIRPAGLSTELQMGYKSNRNFVLTSAGMMWMEQVDGADLRLCDADGHYVVATAGTATLASGTQAQATVWTGQRVGRGTYAFYSKATGTYLCYGTIDVNRPVTAENYICAWNIVEGIDELQALLNLLAEEQEEEGGQGTTLPTDTLYIALPTYDTGSTSSSKPFVFPAVSYPIKVTGGETGLWNIPNPTPGKPRPADFHPIYIPRGSHVIIDDVTFQDIVGGDHVIYVEGTVEINVSVVLHITNWQWFIHVGPGGEVIWRPTGGDMPRINNEGTMNIYAHVDYLLNTGTVNHYEGNITQVVNHYHYYFTGGTITSIYNYGEHHHEGGTALTAHNYAGGTFTMNSGYIRNTVDGGSAADTVFVNRGTFYFYGGIIGGNGSRLVYHGPGATMRIDGGHFEFDLVKHYWIEAHSFFYIRGDYDYGATMPMLLAPSVTIRLLGSWTYTFPLQFVGGLPTSHYALFRAEGFTLVRDYFSYINWTLPGSRWRWYLNEGDNAIEPRGEEVEDEDDLQAYLDWLAANQDGEAASSEEEPQQLDLKGRTIEVTQPVEIPAGQHVVFTNGYFRPAVSWTHDRMFYIPATTSVRFERVTIDFSSTAHYVVNGLPVQRYIFNVVGNVHFATGSVVKGYFDPTWQFTDDRLPGAVVYIDPAARFYIDGGRFENVIFRMNNVVNTYITANIVNNVYIYVPTAWRNEGFRIVQPWGSYRFTLSDLRRIVLVGATDWTVDADADGYASLLDIEKMGDVNGDGRFDVADIQSAVRMRAGLATPTVRADLNIDGHLSSADLKALVSLIAGKR